MAKRQQSESQLANLRTVTTSEQASALARKRWANTPSKQTRQVQVTLPADLVAAMDASTKKRSELITELLQVWAEQQS